jgi:hypothetical protein
VTGTNVCGWSTGALYEQHITGKTTLTTHAHEHTAGTFALCLLYEMPRLCLMRMLCRVTGP